MIFVTDFADQAVLLPLALVVAAFLGMQGWWRGAAAWLVGIGTTLALMLVLKIAFMACAHDDMLHSPSGHTAAAAVVTGALVVVLSRNRRLVLPSAILAALVIGASRLALGAHTLLEVLVGAAVGIGGAMLTAYLAGPAPVFSRSRTVMAALLVVAILHGMRVPAEAHIRSFAQRIAPYVDVCRAR